MKALLRRLFAADENTRTVDAASLLLRVMVISSLVYHHGMDKIPGWHYLLTRKVPLDPIGIGVVPSIVYATFADLVCGLALLFGFATRIASFLCILCLFAVVFLIDHALTTPFWPVPFTGHAEVAWVYMAVCIYFLIVGPGRYSLDSKLRWFQS